MRYRIINREAWVYRNKNKSLRYGLTKGLSLLDIEAFCSRIVRGSVVDCWEFASNTGESYPRWNNVLAHRLSYELFVTGIPENLTIDHLCGNTRCVNYNHLEPVGSSENSKRYIASLA